MLNIARSLQDANAGSHEWHLRSSRYMNGGDPGRGPARPRVAASGGTRHLGGPAVGGAPSGRPARVLPRAAAGETGFQLVRRGTRTAAADWARRMGLPYSPQAVSWAVTAHHNVSRDRLEVLSQWYVFLAALDGTPRPGVQGARGHGRREGVSETAAAVSHRELATAAQPGRKGLADLWGGLRSTPSISSGSSRPARWELGNSARQRVPDLVDHLQTRRAEHAGLMIDLVVYGLGLPAPRRTALEECFADIATARRDLVTYRDRIGVPTEVSNGVLELQRLLECDLQQAADVVGDLLTARRAQFDRLAADAPADYVEALCVSGWAAISGIVQDWACRASAREEHTRGDQPDHRPDHQPDHGCGPHPGHDDPNRAPRRRRPRGTCSGSWSGRSSPAASTGAPARSAARSPAEAAPNRASWSRPTMWESPTSPACTWNTGTPARIRRWPQLRRSCGSTEGWATSTTTRTTSTSSSCG